MRQFIVPRIRAASTVLVALLVSTVLISCGSGGGEPTPPPVPPAPPSGLSYPAVSALTVGVPMTSITPTVTGTVTSFSVSPALPGGLSLDSATGSMGGTPTVATAAASYTVSAANGSGSTTYALSITINAAAEFQLEPVSGTTIGVGQQIDLFAAFKAHGTAPYPEYLDPAQVSFSSSRPGVANTNNGGQVRGVSAGTATITASYQSWSSQITVSVAGNYLERTVTVPGQGTRKYSIYVPDGISGPRPMLLALHGGGGTARINASTTLLAKLGADQGVYIVLPEGSGVIQTFNAGSCCGSAQSQHVDDVAFLAAVIDDVKSNYSIDADKVYATGFSNGGIMTYRLACTLADRISGIAAVSGASGQFDGDGNSYYPCTPSRPIRVLHLHATNDRNYPYAGGFGEGLSNTNFSSVDATINDWRTRNNVSSQAVIDVVNATTTCFRYETPLDANRPSASVTLCKMDPPDVYDPVTGIVFGGGHSWPGGNRSPSPGSDSPRTDFNANTYLWAFLTH